MDVVVSVLDAKCLSESELISRNLFVSAQIGKTVHPGDGLRLQKARFRSGSAEIPLVLTIKNSLTSTLMYVRNIPISLILEKGSLTKRWIAVYPPGDPQNLHFNAAAVPKDSCPQVCIDVMIEEDLSKTTANARAFSGKITDVNFGSSIGGGSMRFTPEARLNLIEESPFSSSRQAVSAWQSDSGSRVGQGDSISQEGDIMDAELREKQLQAERIKAHMAAMATAQRRAQDVSRSLQESLDELVECRRQLKRLEAEVTEQRESLKVIVNERDKFRFEEDRLQEEIRLNDKLFQDMRESRDQMDRELSKASSTGERQKNSLEESARHFKIKSQAFEADIDSSKRHVVVLKESLKHQETVVADTRQKFQLEETMRVSREAATRQKLSTELDHTRNTLTGVRSEVEDRQQRLRSARTKHELLVSKLATVQEELEGFGNADQPGSAKADVLRQLQQKKASLESQSTKVLSLEEELKENRVQLERHSQRIAMIHSESKEFEIESRQYAKEREALELRLAAQRRTASTASEEQETHTANLADVEKQLLAAQEELEALEKDVQHDQDVANYSSQLEQDVQSVNDELELVKRKVEDLQLACDDLEQTRSLRRNGLQDRILALTAAQQRAEELEAELASARELFEKEEQRKELMEKEADSRNSELAEARHRVKEKMDELSKLKELTSEEASQRATRMSELNATTAALQNELLDVGKESEKAEAERLSLQAEVDRNEFQMAEAKEQMKRLSEEEEQIYTEIDELQRQSDAAQRELLRARETTEQLEQTSRDIGKDLTSLRSLADDHARSMASLDKKHIMEVERIEANTKQLEAEYAESERLNHDLSKQLQEMQGRQSDLASAIAQLRQQKEASEKELETVIAGHAKLIEEGERSLQPLLDELAEARGRSDKLNSHGRASGQTASFSDRNADHRAEEARQTVELEREADRLANERWKIEATLATRRNELTARKKTRESGVDIPHLEQSYKNLQSEVLQMSQRLQVDSARVGVCAENLTQEALELMLELRSLGVEPVTATSGDPTQDKLKKAIRKHTEAHSIIQQLQVDEKVLKSNIHKADNSDLQTDMIQKLMEQKQRLEEETDAVTLALHDSEKQNLMLEKEHEYLKQEVPALQKTPAQVEEEIKRCQHESSMWKQKAQEMQAERHGQSLRNLHERISTLKAEIDRYDRAESNTRRGSNSSSSAAMTAGLTVPQRPLRSGHERRKALLVGSNYSLSHAPLKGCANDVWNMQCLLRHTLLYTADQIRVLVDAADRTPRPDRLPTKANIIAGLQWLVSGAMPGDNLLFVFCGYGTQHPRTPGSDKMEGYLVPSDFAADLPQKFFQAGQEMEATAGMAYRLLSLLEVHDFIMQLPAACRLSIVLDCCFSVLPGVGPESNCPASFKKVQLGPIDHLKLQDYLSRPRYLEVPPLPVQHTPSYLPRSSSYPSCVLHCFSGCRIKEWCAEFPIEGTVQGAFSWAFLKALAQGHFHCNLQQFHQTVATLLTNLKVHFQGFQQIPLLQISQAATMQDIVLWT